MLDVGATGFTPESDAVLIIDEEYPDDPLHMLAPSTAGMMPLLWIAVTYGLSLGPR